jgi:hypothetical protein
LETAEHRPTESRRGSFLAHTPAKLTLTVLAILGISVSVAGVTWPEAIIVVDSSPVGAEVALDGLRVGQTPIRLVSRPWPLRGQVEVRLDGYQPWSGSIESGPGEVRAVKPELVPMPGNITLTSTPSGALVTIDGSAVGLTPITMHNLSPGRHQLSLTLERYKSWQAVLDLDAGGATARDVKLERARVSASPAPTGDSTNTGQSDREAGHRNEDMAEPAQGLTPAGGLPALEQTEPAYPVAVMIENAPAARPQSGLDSADIVFEAMAEGGISRFMAVYTHGAAAVVGPVRSARHYFVNLAAELGASLVFIGASPQGYQSLHEYGLRNLDETHAHPGFWRTRARLAPHNAFTSVAGARQALDGRAPVVEGSWAGFTFKDPALRYDGPPAPRAALVYEPWGYHVEYRYDPSTNQYARFMEGQPHKDGQTGAQIQASSLAVLTVNAWVIDPEGRLDMAQVGSGPAVYFEDGTALEGSWSKSSPTEITHFLDRDGNPIRFNPGPIWVQLISRESKVIY